ncbi:hypothetical protein EDD18DRAFT_1067330, partial [Armillaria luteobubalina]
VKGYSRDVGNDRADELTAQEANLVVEEATPTNIDVDHEFNVDGAKLSTLTQSQVYHLLQAFTIVMDCPSAEHIIGQVMVTVKEVNGIELLPSRLWPSICGKDILHPIKGILWKALQNAFKIGSFCENLGPQYKKREECPHCKVMEFMEHILVDYNIDRQNVLWQLARELWENRG